MKTSSNSPHPPQQKNLRKGRFSEKFASYAITKCVFQRAKILTTREAPKVIMSSLQFFRTSGDLRLLAFCLMPDHLHLLVCLTSEESLSAIMRRFSSFTAREMNRVFNREQSFWQEGFFDHRCRDDDDLCDRAEYIENNPVRAGLVVQPQNWPFSSAYAGHRALLDRDWYFGVDC
jgi:REP element-mobilizing transposase RayT